MKIDEIYVSKSEFLKAADLKGNTVQVEIQGVAIHTFNEGEPDEKKQLVLSFKDKEKKLGLNVTNANSISKQLGPDTDDWIGGTIKLYPTTTEFGDKKDVPCIRIVEELPPPADVPW